MSFYTYGFMCGFRNGPRVWFGEQEIAQADFDMGYAAGQQELQLDIAHHNNLTQRKNHD